MGSRIGSGFIGSSDLQTSTANQEVIPASPSHWAGGYNLYKFTFINVQACHVKINNGNQIYLKANQGFTMSEIDATVHSFQVIESGIDFNWLGAY